MKIIAGAGEISPEYVDLVGPVMPEILGSFDTIGLSDAQSGADARRTGASFVDSLKDPRCEDGTKVASLTIE